jgi:hypothetical protein
MNFGDYSRAWPLITRLLHYGRLILQITSCENASKKNISRNCPNKKKAVYKQWLRQKSVLAV